MSVVIATTTFKRTPYIGAGFNYSFSDHNEMLAFSSMEKAMDYYVNESKRYGYDIKFKKVGPRKSPYFVASFETDDRQFVCTIQLKEMSLKA